MDVRFINFFLHILFLFNLYFRKYVDNLVFHLVAQYHYYMYTYLCVVIIFACEFTVERHTVKNT